MLPKYKQIKEKLRAAILKGEIQANQKISSEHELVEIYQVSRHTVRQALGELVLEGWLYREHGKGTYCSGIPGHQMVQRAADQQLNPKYIGIITTYFSEYIFPSIIRGAESYLQSKGYTLLLASTNNNYENEKICLENFLDKQVSGIIVEPTKSAHANPNLHYYLELEKREIPYVMINAAYQELSAVSVTIDDIRGGFLATEHLLSLGHKRIVGIFKTDDLQGVGRMKGYLNAHRHYRQTVQPELVLTYATEEQNDRPQALVKQLLEQGLTERPSAIFCYNDQLALIILDAIRELGLRVPQDISLVGFDNSHLAQATEVKITSLSHPKSKLGEEAAKRVVMMIENPAHAKGLTAESIYQPELILRSSTKRY
jgi:GntR family transcriptional regulator of arabinose operon